LLALTGRKNSQGEPPSRLPLFSDAGPTAQATITRPNRKGVAHETQATPFLSSRLPRVASVPGDHPREALGVEHAQRQAQLFFQLVESRAVEHDRLVGLARRRREYDE